MLETKGEKIFNVVNIVFLSVISVICLYPLLYVLFASLSEATSFEQNAGFLLWPQNFTIGAYKLVFRNIMIGIVRSAPISTAKKMDRRFWNQKKSMKSISAYAPSMMDVVSPTKVAAP